MKNIPNIQLKDPYEKFWFTDEVYPNQSGIDAIIFICINGYGGSVGKRTPVLMVSNLNKLPDAYDSCISEISLENCEILNFVKTPFYEKVKKFIEINKEYLIRYWNRDFDVAESLKSID